jgi:WD40 repeat protein
VCGCGKVRLAAPLLSFPQNRTELAFLPCAAVGPADFECLAVLMEHSQDVKCVTWHPRDELLASASYDDLIKLYAADPYDDEWQCVHTLAGHSATVWSVSFSPCGNYLASAGDDLVIKLWERIAIGADGKDLGALGEAKPEDGGRMGPWSAGGVRIGVKEKFRWEMRGEIEGAHERTIYSVDWQEGGKEESEGGLGRIVTAGGDGRINVFQMVRFLHSSFPFSALTHFCRSRNPPLPPTHPPTPFSPPSKTPTAFQTSTTSPGAPFPPPEQPQHYEHSKVAKTRGMRTRSGRRRTRRTRDGRVRRICSRVRETTGW